MEDLMEASTDLTITEIITVELQTITDAYFDDDDLLTDPPLRCDGYEIFGVWI